MRPRVIFAFAIVISTIVMTIPTRVVEARSTQATTCLPASPGGSGPSSALVSANNSFGFKLLRHIVDSSKGANVFISPASVSLALEMAYDGARGSTAAGMSSALGLGGMTQAQVRAQASALLVALKSNDPKVQLQVANALWARNSVTFNPAFIPEIAAAFDAGVHQADFNNPATVGDINDWVSCATHGTINSIIGQLTPDQVMVLLNAVYFHGNWTSPFKSADTRPATFTTGDGTAKQLPFMNQRATYSYSAGGNYQAITLPYGAGRYVMKIVLPSTGTPVSSLVDSLSDQTWTKWTGSTQKAEVTLSLPRFTIKYSGTLTSQLAGMGMASAFQRGANFTGICPRCLISTVIHKTHLAVDEKGTTAAAVTGVVIGISAEPVHQVTMTVNRPFIVALEDETTGSVLFAGAITNPAG